jgi:hypothetical protein
MVDGASGRLQRDDLIQDREVGSPDDDRLAHLHVVQQLHHLTVSVLTPTNIAVWGPWGSGKSGVANLLAGSLGDRPSVGFVRFDAFKYAENPLRRNFIAVVASQLGIADQKFHDDLYSGKVTSQFTFTFKDTLQVLHRYLEMFAVVCSVSLSVVVLLAWGKKGPFVPAFVSMAGDVLRAGLAPAALLTSLAVLVSRTLTKEHRVDPASSDEQFEDLLDDLVRRSKLERLVVFVDELDRCAPRDVVATLDALRTFLGVPRCVFVVAADQQVLEEALTQALEQATPADPANPYYSSGSGYLDKVFPYQISLPPLLVPQVSRFAADLVRGHGGLWDHLDVDLVVSILIPSHVRSPRRVKVLLNRFALTYRLAEQRFADGLLDADVAARADEIARLVCLRVEFPLFARDLLMDHRLPDHVLALVENNGAELDTKVPEVRQVALRYALVGAPIDRNLSDLPGGDDAAAAAVRARQGQQLLDYLARTRPVAGPGRDLIYLQTSGSVFGLASEVAEALEQHAQNAALGQLGELLAGMSVPQRSAAVQLLTQQARAALGVEAWNVAQAVLLVCGQQDLPLAEHADHAIEAISPGLFGNPHVLPPVVLTGGWRLSQAGSREGASRLAALVLGHAALEDDPQLVAAVMQDLPAALAADRERVVDLLCGHLQSDTAGETAAVLAALPAGPAEQAMTAVAPPLRAAVQAAITAHGSAATTPAPGAADLAGAPVPAWPEQVLAALAVLLDGWSSTAPRAAHAVLALLLGLDHSRVRDLVEDRLAHVPPVTDTLLAGSVLTTAAQQDPSCWPAWLAVLDPHVQIADLTYEVQQLLRGLWRDALADAPKTTAETVSEIAAAYLALVENLPAGGYPDLTDIVTGDLDGFAETDTAAQQRHRLLVAARTFTDCGLLDRRALHRHEAAALTRCLTCDDGDQPEPGSPMSRYLADTLEDCLNGFDRSGDHPLSQDQARDLFHALDACTWLPEPDATTLAVTARTSVRELPLGISAALRADATAMKAFAKNHPAHAAPALAGWIQLNQPSATGLLTALADVITRRRPAHDLSMLEIAGKRLGQIPAGERMQFWQGLIGEHGPTAPSEDNLASLGWAEVPDTHATDLLIARYSASTNQPERQAVLAMWHAASIASTSCRRRLTEQILLPMLALNQATATTALSYLARLADPIPHGTRKALRDAVETAASQWSRLRPPAVRAMEQLGYTIERRGLFRTRETIKEVPPG